MLEGGKVGGNIRDGLVIHTTWLGDRGWGLGGVVIRKAFPFSLLRLKLLKPLFTADLGFFGFIFPIPKKDPKIEISYEIVYVAHSHVPKVQRFDRPFRLHPERTDGIVVHIGEINATHVAGKGVTVVNSENNL